MQFSDSTGKSGIVEEIDFLIGSDNNTYPLTEKTRNCNRAMDKITARIFNADGVWEWDDSNQTDLPIATTSLVNGQYDYSFAITHLKITRVLAQDSTGKWITLEPFDITQDKAQAYLIASNNNGAPLWYDKTANSIFLSPTPDYDATGGLKIYFQRPSTYFATTDTTKTPGFPAIFHRYISLSAAYDYAMAKDIPIVNLSNELTKMELDIDKYFSKRNDRDERTAFIPKLRNYE